MRRRSQPSPARPSGLTIDQAAALWRAVARRSYRLDAADFPFPVEQRMLDKLAAGRLERFLADPRARGHIVVDNWPTVLTEAGVTLPVAGAPRAYDQPGDAPQRHTDRRRTDDA